MNCEGLREANQPTVVSMMSLLVQMMTTAIYGVPIAPAALADEKGNAVVVQQIASIHSLEHMLRPVSSCHCFVVMQASTPSNGFMGYMRMLHNT